MTRKPDRVFDRDSEWDALIRFATSASPDVRLGIVSGRRRQGKTFLLDAVTEATGGMFYSATDTTEALALADFAAALADRTGGGRYALSSWDDALERLFSVVTGGIIVLDEFPYLSRSTPALPSLIQRALGPRGYAHSAQARLLLCGSAMSVMGQLLGGTAPLRGRASLELVIRPLGYRESARFWGVSADPRLAVLLNSVVGGTPAYRREFVAGDAPESVDDFDSWILRTILSPEIPLFREARYLLSEDSEIRDTAIYHAVLAAIAEGNNTRGGIASYIGRKSPDIGHPLAVLEDSQLITREGDPFRKGRSYYRICEPLIVFYEAVMRRAWTRLERGDKSAIWHAAQSAFSSQVVGPHFEAICRDWAASPAAAAVFGERTAEVGATTVADPVRHGQIQVDVAVLAPEEHGRPRRVLSLGEAKWGKTMTVRHLDRLRRARDLLSVRGHDTTGTKLACYGGSGFDADLRAVARAQHDVLLIGVKDLYY